MQAHLSFVMASPIVNRFTKNTFYTVVISSAECLETQI